MHTPNIWELKQFYSIHSYKVVLAYKSSVKPTTSRYTAHCHIVSSHKKRLHGGKYQPTHGSHIKLTCKHCLGTYYSKAYFFSFNHESLIQNNTQYNNDLEIKQWDVSST